MHGHISSIIPWISDIFDRAVALHLRGAVPSVQCQTYIVGMQELIIFQEIQSPDTGFEYSHIWTPPMKGLENISTVQIQKHV